MSLLLETEIERFLLCDKDLKKKREREMNNTKVMSSSSAPAETYFFARGVSSPIASQIQRLHADRHADPVFDIKQRSCKASNTGPMGAIRRKRGSSFGEESATPAPPPKARFYYQAMPYDSPQSNLIHFSRCGVAFNPSSTPRISERRRNSDDGRFRSSPSSSTSSLSETLEEGDSDDLILWRLVPRKSDFILVDKYSGGIIGRWKPSRRRRGDDERARSDTVTSSSSSTSTASDNSSWNFIYKGKSIAKLRENTIQINAPDHSNDIFVDDVTRTVRRRQMRRSASGGSTGSSGSPPPSPSLETPCPTAQIRKAMTVAVPDHYRARLVDAIIFSSLALKLAWDDNDTEVTSPRHSLQLLRPIIPRSMSASRAGSERPGGIPSALSSIVSGFKQVVSF